MTHLKDSCYLKTLVAILSRRKQLTLASLVGYLWFNRRVWFIGHETSSAGIHQLSDTPNRHILCLLEMVHSTVFPGTDPVGCELFIAHNACANAWFCSEKEWDALGWYRVKGINSDIVGAAPGPCDHGWSDEPRNSRPNQKWSWDVDVRRHGLKIRIFGKTFFWDAALLLKMCKGAGAGGLGGKNTRIWKFFRSAQKILLPHKRRAKIQKGGIKTVLDEL